MGAVTARTLPGTLTNGKMDGECSTHFLRFLFLVSVEHSFVRNLEHILGTLTTIFLTEE